MGRSVECRGETLGACGSLVSPCVQHVLQRPLSTISALTKQRVCRGQPAAVRGRVGQEDELCLVYLPTTRLTGLCYSQLTSMTHNLAPSDPVEPKTCRGHTYPTGTTA